MLKSLRFLLFACLTMVCGSVFAEAFSEDFESVTITDADSWGYGAGLSNGWKIVGGTIYAYEGTTNYGLVKKTGKGHDNSNCYLEASYASSNAASVFVAQQITGDEVTFWVKCSSTSSSTKGKVIIYEANADGSVTTTKLFEEQVTGGQAWAQKTVSGVNGKYIAINLVRAQFDDYAVIEGVAPAKTPSLVFGTYNISNKVNLDEVYPIGVNFSNEGDGDAENVKLQLYVDDQLNAEVEKGNLAAGASATFTTISYDLTNIEDNTDHEVYLALAADGAELVKTEAVSVNFYRNAPQATFTLTAQPVEVEYAAENITVVVNVKNTSEVDAENVEVKLQNGLEYVGETQTIATLAAGEDADVTFTFANPFTEAGEYTLTAQAPNAGCYVTVTMKEAPLHVAITNMEAAAAQYNIQAASYTGATLKVTMQNKDDKEVRANLQILKTGTNEVVAEQEYKLEANQERTVEVLVNETVAGTYKYYANVTNSEDLQHVWPAMNAVQVTFVDAVEGIDLAISATPAATVDLDNGAFVSAVIENNGTMDAEEAVLTLFVDGEENNTVELGTIAAGKSKFQSIAYDVTKIEAGEHQVYVAVAAGKNVAQTEATTVTFTKKAPETSFTVTTEKKVEVADNVATVDIVAMVTNTSEIDAENVEVKLYDGLNVLATETIATLAAGATQEVRMTLNTADFTPERDYNLHIIVADKAEAFLTLRVIDTTLGIAAAKAARGENGQIFTIDGKKAAAVKKGNIYVVNGKKVVVK